MSNKLSQFTTTELQAEINRRDLLLNTAIKLFDNADMHEEALTISCIRNNTIQFKLGTSFTYSIGNNTTVGTQYLTQLRNLCDALLDT
jgi:hypothetical protein